MDDYITAERRGRESLRRFLLDLDAKEANEREERSIGEVLELYLQCADRWGPRQRSLRPTRSRAAQAAATSRAKRSSSALSPDAITARTTNSRRERRLTAEAEAQRRQLAHERERADLSDLAAQPEIGRLWRSYESFGSVSISSIETERLSSSETRTSTSIRAELSNSAATIDSFQSQSYTEMRLCSSMYDASYL
jgi:hypothetical protein